MSIKTAFSSKRVRLIAVTSAALLCFASLTVPTAAHAASVFKVATSAAVTTWDPIQSFSTEAFYMTNIYEPLLWKNPDGVSPEYTPALATSWSSSKVLYTWINQSKAPSPISKSSRSSSIYLETSIIS